MKSKGKIMFKSKVEFSIFDRNNTKVKNLELTKAKALAKAGVKKLQSSHNTATTFHLALNYFKDDKGNPLEHFIGFGENKKLDKHFQQIEMKSGKMDKSMTASPKEASMGNAYIKSTNGNDTLCFEPNANSKIPQGKWPKILKELKAWFGGIKAVAIFDGEVVEDKELEDKGQGEETSSKRSKRISEGKKIKENLNKVEKVIGKLDSSKMERNLSILNEAYEKLRIEAMKDGNIDANEQRELDSIQNLIQEKKVTVQEVEEIKKLAKKVKDIIKSF